MIKNAVKLEQYQVNSYLFKMNADDLINNSSVDIYDPKSNPNGYQRPLNSKHAKEIALYLLEDVEPIMLSIIIIAIDSLDLEFRDNKITLKNGFRVVDGQHRIEGLKLLKKFYPIEYEELLNNEYAVLALEIGENQKHYEIGTFIDINSKSKKVSTDLAIQLRSKIRKEIGIISNDKNFEEEVGKIVAERLNNDEQSIWYEAIKEGPHQKAYIISINAFITSLKKLIKLLKKSRNINYPIELYEVESIANEIYLLIKKTWDLILDRWELAFENGRYNKNYTIQKGLGVNSFHIVLTEIFEENDFDIEKTLLIFEDNIINNSITIEDWKIGGAFSQFSSGAGYKKLAELLIMKREQH